MFVITKKEMRFLVASIVVMVLCGCASDSFRLGIAESDWANYSADEQHKLLANYRKIVVDYNNVAKDKTRYSSDLCLEVYIYGGKVMVPPFNEWSDYKPVKFPIFRGQCCSVVLLHPTRKNSQTELTACFYGNTLYLDPSHYDLTKKNGSISIHFSPLWLSGFSYKGISSSGYVRLNGVTIEIRQIEIKRP